MLKTMRSRGLVVAPMCNPGTWETEAVDPELVGKTLSQKINNETILVCF